MHGINTLYVRDFQVRVGYSLKAHDLVEDALGARLEILESALKTSLNQLFTGRHILWNEQTEVQDELPQVLRGALFVQSYALFERSLRLIAESVGQQRGLRITVSDLRGDGIGQSVEYLRKACGVVVPTNTKEWADIRALQKVRNILSHRRGVLDPSSEVSTAVRTFAKSHSAELVIESGELRLGSTFVPFAIATMQQFMNLLRLALP